jgi:hypothetical protein
MDFMTRPVDRRLNDGEIGFSILQESDSVARNKAGQGGGRTGLMEPFAKPFRV